MPSVNILALTQSWMLAHLFLVNFFSNIIGLTVVIRSSVYRCFFIKATHEQSKSEWRLPFLFISIFAPYTYVFICLFICSSWTVKLQEYRDFIYLSLCIPFLLTKKSTNTEKLNYIPPFTTSLKTKIKDIDCQSTSAYYYYYYYYWLDQLE